MFQYLQQSHNPGRIMLLNGNCNTIEEQQITREVDVDSVPKQAKNNEIS